MSFVFSKEKKQILQKEIILSLDTIINKIKNPSINQKDIPEEWNSDFKAKYALQVSFIGKQTYEQLKEYFIEDFCKIQKLHSDFIPKISFNDLEKQVEIPYAYNHFLV